MALLDSEQMWRMELKKRNLSRISNPDAEQPEEDLVNLSEGNSNKAVRIERNKYTRLSPNTNSVTAFTVSNHVIDIHRAFQIWKVSKSTTNKIMFSFAKDVSPISQVKRY